MSVNSVVQSKSTRFVFAFALSAAVLLFIFTQFDFSTVSSLISNIRLWYLIPAVGANILAIVATSCKFNIFFKTVKESPPVSTAFLWSAMALHYFYINMFPFRLGEATFFILLRKKYKAHENLSNLVLARLLDAVALFAILAVSTLVVFSESQVIAFVSKIHWKPLFFVGGMIVCLASLVGLAQWRWQMVSAISRAGMQIRIVAKIFGLVGNSGRLLIDFWAHHKLQLISITAYSIVQFLLFAASMFCLYLFFGIQLTYFQIVWLGSVTTVVGFLPIHGLFGIGSAQLVAIGILLLFGIPKNICGPLSMGIHIVYLVSISVVGALGGIVYTVLSLIDVPETSTNKGPAGDL